MENIDFEACTVEELMTSVRDLGPYLCTKIDKGYIFEYDFFGDSPQYFGLFIEDINLPGPGYQY